MIRKLPAAEERVETGAVQFGDDWAGTFIRGDVSHFYATCLEAVLSGTNDVFQRMAMAGLLEDLKDSNVFRPPKEPSPLELHVWKCDKCGIRVQTLFDLRVNQRPVCVNCNMEMALEP
jgi:hypothetical protein